MPWKNPIPNSSLSIIQIQIRRKKKETALTKHKRWLAELQKKKDNLELQYTVDYIKDAQSKDAFMEGERKIRKQAKEILKPSVKTDEKASAAGETAESKDSSKSPIAQEKKADSKGLNTIECVCMYVCMYVYVCVL